MANPDITPGAPCWIDLMTSDPDKAKDFYAQLFGWDYEVGDQETYGGYTTAFKDGRSVAGLMKNDGQSGYPDVWTTYLRVEDINAAVEAVTAADGQIFMPPMVVPEQGSMGMIGDASGAAVGVWQFGGHTGFQAHGEPGAAVWHELHTRDYATAVKFYENVFGWETSVMSDTAEFRYTTLGAAEGAKAGILDASAFLPEGVPANWQVYFGVENTDAAIEKALSLGGQLIQPAENTPFGRLATLADPTGAMFKIDQENV
ncbi:VOC family protein [Paenarthrobacter sp. PH39-S1]|uniref:VOC family protein n=1 Tax=Paenarthrobacter sp. PH39-S1 TaxID=3046204 RepID=UPI0024BB1307|nr:VOC family protein [Paenarthrobacter sp. PH39-S1]MDJ0355031.1 VOC family protein [Paenarthrobacter sp. PH39-S1]